MTHLSVILKSHAYNPSYGANVLPITRLSVDLEMWGTGASRVYVGGQCGGLELLVYT
jgi:hypothetical protein